MWKNNLKGGLQFTKKEIFSNIQVTVKGWTSILHNNKLDSSCQPLQISTWKKMSKFTLTIIVAFLFLTVCISAQNINNIFPLISSLDEEDKLGLRGVAYNISQVSFNTSVINLTRQISQLCIFQQFFKEHVLQLWHHIVLKR